MELKYFFCYDPYKNCYWGLYRAEFLRVAFDNHIEPKNGYHEWHELKLKSGEESIKLGLFYA